jgi:4-hydroxy-3-methylbut-2-enyl diphosphate reductase
MGSRAEEKEPTQRPKLDLLLAAPRGFCAGVERAIRIVELALAKFGAPVYVRHEIVHNRYVVERLQKLGAIFIEQIEEVPTGARVIFSAHGVPKSVPVQAGRRHLQYLDATCPLVSKVHLEAERHYRAGREIVLIGHAGHAEVEGTLGQLPAGAITLLENIADAEIYEPRHPDRLAYITQTTLSVDDTHTIVELLRQRFPLILGPHKEDICYATTNRQEAIKAIAPRSDAVFVIGAPNSSNSRRLVEAAIRAGAHVAQLIQRAADIDWAVVAMARTIGLSAGASAPESLVDEVIAAFRERYDVRLEEVALKREDIIFNVPRALAS